LAVSLGGVLTAAQSSPFSQLNPGTYDYVVPATGEVHVHADGAGAAEPALV